MSQSVPHYQKLDSEGWGWKVADFCRACGLHRNTPGRWRYEDVAIPNWVPRHLGLLLDLKRLHAAHTLPTSPKDGTGDSWFLQDLARLHDAYLTPPATDD